MEEGSEHCFLSLSNKCAFRYVEIKNHYHGGFPLLDAAAVSEDPSLVPIFPFS